MELVRFISISYGIFYLLHFTSESADGVLLFLQIKFFEKLLIGSLFLISKLFFRTLWQWEREGREERKTKEILDVFRSL